MTTEDVDRLAKALSWPHITGDIASDVALERLYKKEWLHAEALSDLDAQVIDIFPTYLHKWSVIRFSAIGFVLMLTFGLDPSSTY